MLNISTKKEINLINVLCGVSIGVGIYFVLQGLSIIFLVDVGSYGTNIAGPMPMFMSFNMILSVCISACFIILGILELFKRLFSTNKKWWIISFEKKLPKAKVLK